MILFILLFINLKVSCQSLCECQQLTLKNECFYAGCKWIQNVQTNQFECIDKLPYNQPICSDFKDHLVCDFIQGCAWSNQGKCELFTKCSDYRINQSDQSDQCYLKDHTCIEGVINEKFISCTSIQEFCMNEELQQLGSSETFLSLDSQGIVFYSQMETMKLQKNFQCIQEKKKNPQCSNIESELICTFLRNDEYVSICEWKNNQCQDSVQARQLSESNCFLYTGGTHSWNNNQCMICSRNSTYSTMIPVKKRNLFETSKTPTLTFSQVINITQNYEEKIVGNNFHQTTNWTLTISTMVVKNCYIDLCYLTLSSEWKWDFKAATQPLETDYGTGSMQCALQATIKNITDANQKILKTQTEECLHTWVHEYQSGGVRQSVRTSNLQEKTVCNSTEIINSLTDGNNENKCEISGEESIEQNFNGRTTLDRTKIIGNSTLIAFTSPDDKDNKIPVLQSQTTLDRSIITNNEQSTEVIEKTVFKEQKKFKDYNQEGILSYETKRSERNNNRSWKCDVNTKQLGSRVNLTTSGNSSSLQNGQKQLNSTTEEHLLYIIASQGQCIITENDNIKNKQYTLNETQVQQIITSLFDENKEGKNTTADPTPKGEPNQPSQPNQPNLPDQPSQPSQPSEPSVPNSPKKHTALITAVFSIIVLIN